MIDRAVAMAAYLEGATTMAYLIAALFFLRFWHRSRDRFFLCFTGAFALMALSRLMVTFWQVPDDDAHYLYVVRLGAYLLIIWAIVDKNRARRME